jgi:hypothetical protein
MLGAGDHDDMRQCANLGGRQKPSKKTPGRTWCTLDYTAGTKKKRRRTRRLVNGEVAGTVGRRAERRRSSKRGRESGVAREREGRMLGFDGDSSG